MLQIHCFFTGTYGSRQGLVNETECSFCDSGSYCEIEGLSAPTGFCQDGHYCVLGVSQPTPVSGGSHTGTGDICPAGFYCPTGSPYFTPCDPGTYAPTDGYSSCHICPAGKNHNCNSFTC